MADYSAAKQDVEGIAKEYGFIQPSTLDEIGRNNPEHRREIEESMLAKDKKIGHSIQTLARNIYSSNARFVFELLQNADDNQFKRAIGRDERPYISFKVFPSKIIIDCNEDGFTKENLSAMCAVGESTKASSHGYIGAKGIGFKSVFIAAWKVKIQSGNYSFYFKHNKGDLGLGMVLPVWEDANELLPDSLTRITLHLHQEGDSEEIKHLHGTIFKQLSDLEPTCLLFLKNLKQIKLAFFDSDENDNAQSEKTFELEENNSRKVSLKCKSVDDKNELMEARSYYVTRYTATKLPKSNNRELPATPEGQRASAKAEIVLAFPLTIKNEPLLEPQSIFAFLPVRKSSFTFLIQSDFDTTASRQDISSSRRNTALLDHVASAFYQSVLDFNQEKDLKYTWPLYLPSRKATVATIWADLHSMIWTKLSEESIIYTRNNRSRTIASTVKPSTNFRDSDGNVLSDSTVLDPFISDHYSLQAKNALSDFGLKSMSWKLGLKLLRVDLEKPMHLSRMRSASTNDDTHTRMAKFLSQAAASLGTEALMSLRLLPLRDGTWVCPTLDVYFPTSKGISIPSSLDFKILHSRAAAHKDRSALFSELGVSEIELGKVRESILRKNSPLFLVTHITTEESRDHLRFLYQTHQFRNEGEDFKHFALFLRDERLVKPYSLNCYIPLDIPYGPMALLGATESSPGMGVSFIHPIYIEGPLEDDRPWLEWLQKNIRLMKEPELVDRYDRNSLSLAWYYLAEHRPGKLLDFLKHAWKSASNAIHMSISLLKILRETDARKLCRVELPVECQLDETYLPLPDIVAKSKRFLDSDQPFPFLKLSVAETIGDIISEWLFLNTKLGVRKDDKMEFLLDILKWFKISNRDASSIEDYKRIFKLYSAMDAKFYDAENKPELQERIRSFFLTDDYIFVPMIDEGDIVAADWAHIDKCLWDGPEKMLSKYSLASVYGHLCDQNELSNISRFFTQVLDIKSAIWSDLTEELIVQRDKGPQQFGHVLDLYEYLHGMKIAVFAGQLKHAFQEEPLIFVTSNYQVGWYKTSECLWSSTTSIRGKVTLNEDYEGLEDFFIKTLGVQTLTIQMVYDDLMGTNSASTIDETVSKIWSLNALLPGNRSSVDPEELRRKRIFPVVYPDGTTALVSTSTQFAIKDREYLALKFSGKIKILNFNQEEVRDLKVFFDWIMISHRYISASIKELTSISGDTAPYSPFPTCDFKYKAYAILRVAHTFKSPRYKADDEELYRALQTAKIEVANTINTVLRISQGGKINDVEETGAKLHIAEHASNLTFYIPRDRKSQNLCFCKFLPEQLADWLMRDPTTQILLVDKIEDEMVNVMTKIFCIDPSALYEILSREGIDEIDITNTDMRVEDDDDDGDGNYSDIYLDNSSDDNSEDDYSEDDDLEDDDLELDDLELEELRADNLIANSLENDAGDAHSTESLEEPTGAEDDSATENSESSTQSPDNMIPGQDPTSPQPPRPRLHPFIPVTSPDSHLPDEDAEYQRLLIHVTSVARQNSFPSSGAFNMDDLNQAIRDVIGDEQYEGFDGPGVMGAFRSGSQLERDKKIGAAGELYVFEVLTNRLDQPLPNWNTENWQSTIRRYVTGHPDYNTMVPWHGRETADFVYDDTEGVFTSLLIDRGYIEARGWANRRPKYFIEVKTTTGPLGTPFYMSKHQFRRMGMIHNREDHSEVYLILRVFNIRRPNAGMCLYCDPERLRLDGGLVFTGETWSVVPG